jgi:hypothetical protein
MAASGAIASPGEAFTLDWIADGGRAYVGRYALDPVHAIRLVRGAGGVAVLAHPRAGRDWEVSDEEISRLAAAGLAGVEVFHPDQSDTERAGLLALAHDLGLVATGGSDDHGSLTGYRIGCETVSADAYQALISRAVGPGRRNLAPLGQLGVKHHVRDIGFAGCDIRWRFARFTDDRSRAVLFHGGRTAPRRSGIGRFASYRPRRRASVVGGVLPGRERRS